MSLKRNDVLSKYYLKKSDELGWGYKSATIDPERVSLLKDYLLGNKILDIGCGTGIYVDLISSWGFQCWGIDHVESFISQASNIKKGKYLVGKAERLPFSKNDFDTVLLFDIIEHVDDQTVIKEAKRVASKRVIVIAPKIVDQSLEQSGLVFRHYIDKSHIREYKKDDFKHLAKKTGLRIERIMEIHNINNKAVFFSLFEGSVILKKILFRISSLFLKHKRFATEYFVIMNK